MSHSTTSRATHLRPRRFVLAAALGLCLAVSGPASAAPFSGGFKTSQAAMLMAPSQAALAQPGVSWSPIITVGETVGGYRFEAIPDGIALRTRGQGRVDVYVNHETSTVPFPYVPAAPTATNSSNDFDNSQLSLLALNRHSAGVLNGRYAIPSSANYQRFCSNFLATAAEGFDREILFTNEEATDFVSRTGTAWPAPASEPPSEQAGVVVAYDVKSHTYRSIYGMGRHNHENSVAIPGYDDVVLLSGDDTFSAPSSQLYSYIAADADAVWNDQGHLWAFKSDVATINDYGDLSGAASVSGTFIAVPDSIADGLQTPLESWSNQNNVFQFIRVEDIAYDRTNPNVVYIADTGEPRAVPGSADAFDNPPRLARGPSGTMGAYPNGRIFKMVLDPSDPKVVTSLSILIDGDAGGYSNPLVIHQPDNLETTATSLLIQEDPGSHQGSANNARIWRWALPVGGLTIVAEVDQSADGGPTDVDGLANAPKGVWESSGIVDASAAFGPGAFLVDVQAHSLWVEKAPGPDLVNPGSGPDWTYKREGGQLLLLRIPGG